MFSDKQVVLLIMLAIVAAGFAATLLHANRRNRLRSVGKPAAADVIEVKTERILRSEATDHDWTDSFDRFMNERKYTYTFYYTIDGVAYTREVSRESSEQQYWQGETVDIFYNPENPKEMMTALELSAPSPISARFALVCGAVVLVVLFFLFK